MVFRKRKFRKRFKKFKKFQKSKRVGGILTRPFKANKLPMVLRFEHVLQIDPVTVGRSLYAYRLYDPANPVWTTSNIALNSLVQTQVTDANNGSTNVQQWIMYANLFDMYRVMALKVSIYLASNVSTTAGAVSNNVFYTWFDLDNLIATGTAGTAVNTTTANTGPATGQQYFMDYNTLKRHELASTRSQKRYLKVPKMTQVQAGVFNPLVIDQNGYINCTSSASPQNGAMYVYLNQVAGSKFAVNTAWATAVVQYYIVFKMRV